MGFLSGLIGGLKSIGSELGHLPEKVKTGQGMLGSLAGVPGPTLNLPAEAGTGGKGLLGSLIGPTGFNWDALNQQPSFAQVAAPAAEAAPAKKPGFFKRINIPNEDTGLSFSDKLGRFGAQLQDIDDGGSRAGAYNTLAKERLALTKQKALNNQIDQLFPNDPRMAFLLKASPDKAAGALADVYKSQNEAYTLGQGQRRGQAGQMIDYNPEVGTDGGYGYATTPDGQVAWGAQRPQSWAEAEAVRSHQADEENARGRLDVARGQLGVAQGQLGVARGHLGIARGKAAGGGAGGGGLSNMSTADLVAALRGAR